MEDDKVLLRKKATDLGISESELEKMISAQIKGQNYEPVIGKNINSEPQNLQVKEPQTLKEEKKEVTEVLKNIKPEEIKIEEKPENIVVPEILKDIKKEEIKVEEKKVEIKTPEIIKEVKKEEIKTEEKIIPEVLKNVKKEEIKVTEQKTEVKKEIVVEKKVVEPPVKEVIVENKKSNKQVGQQGAKENEPKAGGSKMLPIIIIVGILALATVGFIFKDKIFGSSETVENNDDNNNNSVDKQNAYAKFIELGKNAFAGQDYLKSKNNFDSALVYKPGDSDAQTWVSKLSQIISLSNEAKELFTNKNVARAKLRYDSLLVIAPDEKTAIENLRKCDEIIKNAKSLNPEKSEKESKFGYSDSNGYIVIDYVFQNAKEFFGSLAPVQNSAGKWGLIGEDFPTKKENIVDFKFDSIKKEGVGYTCKITSEPYYYNYAWRAGKLIEKKY